MRFPLLLLLSLGVATAVRAEPASNASASLFAERAALLAADAKCALLAAPVRTALIATTGQARSGAFREGWSEAKLDGVSARAAQAGRARDCRDPAVTEAAQRAAAGYAGWSKQASMDLPGAVRVWRARRNGDGQGWVLYQDMPAGRFGLRLTQSGDGELLLVLPADPAGKPGSAQIFIRDRARAPRPLLDVPGLITSEGLAAGAAPRSLAASWIASDIKTERAKNSPPAMAITFPPALLTEMAALAPRETAEIALNYSGGVTQKLYIEIGDLGVARAFLAAAPIQLNTGASTRTSAPPPGAS